MGEFAKEADLRKAEFPNDLFYFVRRNGTFFNAFVNDSGPLNGFPRVDVAISCIFLAIEGGSPHS